MYTYVKHKKCNHYVIECEEYPEEHVEIFDSSEVQTKCVYGLLILVSIPVVYKLILYFVPT